MRASAIGGRSSVHNVSSLVLSLRFGYDEYPVIGGKVSGSFSWSGVAMVLVTVWGEAAGDPAR
jgi:hypothetical protein